MTSNCVSVVRYFIRHTFKLVVVNVENLEVLLGHPASRLVFIHAQDGLEHLYHLILGLVPHGRTSINTWDLVRGHDFGWSGVGGVSVDGYRIIVLGKLE